MAKIEEGKGPIIATVTATKADGSPGKFYSGEWTNSDDTVASMEVEEVTYPTPTVKATFQPGTNFDAATLVKFRGEVDKDADEDVYVEASGTLELVEQDAVGAEINFGKQGEA